MRELIVSLVILVLGIGAGFGIGIMISKPKIDEAQKDFEQLQTQMQTEKDESEKTLQRAAMVISRKDSELKRTKNLLMQITAQLSTAKAEIQEIKGRNPESAVTSTESAEPEVVITTPTGTAASTTRTIDYTIKDGDSLWKIAQEQLGDGLRYKEILKLNPNISENQTLTVGTKIKIPTQ